MLARQNGNGRDCESLVSPLPDDSCSSIGNSHFIVSIIVVHGGQLSLEDAPSHFGRTECRSRIAHIPVPQVVEELLDIFKVFSEDRVQQFFFLSAVTTHFQHVVNTVTVVKPRIIKMTVQRKTHHPGKITRVTKRDEIFPVSAYRLVVDVPHNSRRKVKSLHKL